jgi:hypothetical protein
MSAGFVSGEMAPPTGCSGISFERYPQACLILAGKVTKTRFFFEHDSHGKVTCDERTEARQDRGASRFLQ